MYKILDRGVNADYHRKYVYKFLMHCGISCKCDGDKRVRREEEKSCKLRNGVVRSSVTYIKDTRNVFFIVFRRVHHEKGQGKRLEVST